MSDAHDPREPQSLPPDPAGASAPRPQRGTSNTFAGAIFLGLVVFLCAVGWWFSWRPRHPSSVSTASGSPGRARPFPAEAPNRFHAAGSRSSTGRREASCSEILPRGRSNRSATATA